ncbi:MAG: polyphosphate kinase 1 [Chitinophagaceae bacterium]
MTKKYKRKPQTKFITRDISWLSFNERVLQEAKDPQVSLQNRLKFLGIFSNNLDEFFRVRVAALQRMQTLGKKASMHLEDNPKEILEKIQKIVIAQQQEFENIYAQIQIEMAKKKIFIVNEQKLTIEQKEFVKQYFNETVSTNIFPLMIESIAQLPLIHDKSIYLACRLTNTQNSFINSYALIEVPTHSLPRFIKLPSRSRTTSVMLLEDIIRFNLPFLFEQFGFNQIESYVIKITRDAELDIDNDVNSNVISKLEKGLKNRKKGKALRFVYDKTIYKPLLHYLIKLLNLTKGDHNIPGGRIHNFKDFMNFPEHVFSNSQKRKKAFIHPLLVQPIRILDVLEKKDVMLHFPYHSFDSIIDLLRESAIDPNVEDIKITCYRLSKKSKIINALVNAVQNGKKVTVVLELKARFDEESNLHWKQVLEEAGVKVLVGFSNMKIHAKICLISKRKNKTIQYFGFVSTGNLNEDTAKVYGDHCLLTSNKIILSDIKKVFSYIEFPRNESILLQCKNLILSPSNTRNFFSAELEKLTHQKNRKNDSEVIIKLNSLSDIEMIKQLYRVAKCTIPIRMIIRGINCANNELDGIKKNMQAISIVDEYLEHARVLFFKNNKHEKVFISSADWMTRNLDHRIEATVEIQDPLIKEELKEILEIQWKENVKARVFNQSQTNEYIERKVNSKKFRSQEMIYTYLRNKKYE